jgi:uncharacterized damage-inducible protein DinB
MTSETTSTRERADLLETLGRHRHFLRFTVRNLTDEQASARTTTSELSLGGLIKHVAATESNWIDFVLGGAAAMNRGTVGGDSARAAADWSAQFRLLNGETLAGALEHYDEVARRTDKVVTELPDLDASHPLPEAPWFEPGVSWSARRVILHIIAETAQHAGHADILRESLDGSKSMG